MKKETKLNFLILDYILFVIIVSLFVSLFTNIKNVTATDVVFDHYCSAETGRQVCVVEYLDCPNGAEVIATYLGSTCYEEPDSWQYNCCDWRCLGGPIEGCADPNASNFVNTAYIDDGSCMYTDPPYAPGISGGYTGVVNVPVNYGLSGDDPGGYQVRYGVDYSGDQVIDEYVPSSGYVDSGVSRTLSHTWTTTGDKDIFAWTENEWGERSVVFSMRTTSVSGSGIVDGICSSPPDGSFYSSSPSGPYCASGTPTALSGSGPWTWTCNGSGGGTSENCQAELSGSGVTLTVTASQTLGGSIQSTDSIIDTRYCGSPCAKSYVAGSEVTLEAVPSSSYWKFEGWTGGGCFNTDSCTINVNVDTEVSATFSPREFIYKEL